MHEMSLAESIVSLVESHAEAEGFSQVKAIWLEIGELAGVEVEALTFSLEVVMRDTLMDGAQVHIRRLPAEGWCLACSQAVEVRDRVSGCPLCGSHQLQVSGGEALRVAELEVE